MGQTIAGGLVGGLTGILNYFTQQKSLKAQSELAERQYQASKQAYELEQQERNKVNGKTPDLDALLDANTGSSRAPTDLTGGRVKRNKLFNAGTGTLGVTNAGRS
nr:MAG TPA: holin [Caudoviricetes sp.]